MDTNLRALYSDLAYLANPSWTAVAYVSLFLEWVDEIGQLAWESSLKRLSNSQGRLG